MPVDVVKVSQFALASRKARWKYMRTGLWRKCERDCQKYGIMVVESASPAAKAVPLRERSAVSQSVRCIFDNRIET